MVIFHLNDPMQDIFFPISWALTTLIGNISFKIIYLFTADFCAGKKDAGRRPEQSIRIHFLFRWNNVQTEVSCRPCVEWHKKKTGQGDKKGKTHKQLIGLLSL